MNKGNSGGGGGVGVGSASIVLVFAVLCLSVFSLITFVVAGNDRALIEAESNLVVGYYEADALAERILAEILKSDFMPESVLGVEIESAFDWETNAQVVRYLCPVSGSAKMLLVRIIRYADSYKVLSWRMYDTDEWAADQGLDVWGGPDDSFFGDIDMDDPILYIIPED